MPAGFSEFVACFTCKGQIFFVFASNFQKLMEHPYQKYSGYMGWAAHTSITVIHMLQLCYASPDLGFPLLVTN